MKYKSKTKLLYRFLQKLIMIGEINGRTIVPPIYLHDKKFGKSWQWALVLELVIRKCSFIPGKVGRLAKKKIFNHKEYKGKIIFNVNFSCADHRLNEKSLYCDPLSHWFNVFFGYYQIDVPRSSWERPFGYRDRDPGTELHGGDMLRVAKADWNYFSNYMYGVPESKILEHKCNSLNESDYTFIQKKGRIKIGERYWDYAELENFSVITAYQSSLEKEHVNNSILTPVWRDCFGMPYPREGFSESFFPTRMKTAMYMYFSERKDLDLEEDAFSTFVFGGSINLNYPDYATRGSGLSGKTLMRKKTELEKFNNQFLELQLKNARKLIVDEYSGLGFRSKEK